MTLDVPSEYEDILRQAVASGAFANEEEALRHALQLLANQQHEANKSLSDETPFEKAQRLGLIGSAQDLPADLSSNDQHMDGFGRS